MCIFLKLLLCFANYGDLYFFSHLIINQIITCNAVPHSHNQGTNKRKPETTLQTAKVSKKYFRIELDEKKRKKKRSSLNSESILSHFKDLKMQHYLKDSFVLLSKVNKKLCNKLVYKYTGCVYLRKYIKIYLFVTRKLGSEHRRTQDTAPL